MASTQVHHFGGFIRMKRKAKKFSLRKAAAVAGISDKRWWEIEQMAEPGIYGETFDGIAKALGYAEAEELDKAWKLEPAVKPATRKRTGFIQLPPDVIEGLRALLIKGTTLPELVNLILREWISNSGLHPQTESPQTDRGGDPADSQTTVVWRDEQGNKKTEVHPPLTGALGKRKRHGENAASQ